MRFRVRLELSFRRLQQRIRIGSDRGLWQTVGLIRTDARRSMRFRKGPSAPGKPPTAHIPNGLREINFDVHYPIGIVGPRKFRKSNFFTDTTPHMQEFGGTYLRLFKRGGTKPYTFPERSFMWASVKKLQKNNLIQSRFNITLNRSL